MAVRKTRSKLFRVLLSVVLLLVLGIAALPLWFPWVLRPIAKRFGASYANYRRVGYQRFQISGFTLTNGPVNLEAREATAFVPSVWLWRHITGTKDESFLEVDSWKYAPAPQVKTSHSNAPVSVHTVFQIVRKVAAILQKWAPTANATNGTITIQKQIITIPQANWANGELKGRASLANESPLAVEVSTKQAPWTVNISSAPHDFHSAFSVNERDGKMDVTGTANWLTNRIEITAEFPPRGYIPDTASLRMDSFTTPARLIGLEQYGDPTGALRAEWQTNHFNIQLTAKAAPESTNLPPLDIELRASGDTNTAQLDLVKISAPGLQAGLAAPVAISFRPPFLSSPTSLNVTADLDQQHWFVAHGKLAGTAIVSPAEQFPKVSFALSGRGVETTSVTSSNLELTGELNWPVLDVKSARVEMDDGSQVALTGKFDLKQRIVHDGRLNSSGAFGGQYLPAGYSFDSATVAAQFDGPVGSLTNSVKVTVKNLTVPHASPMNVAADWNAEGLNFKTAQVSLNAGGSSVAIKGSTDFAAGEKKLQLATLELSQSNHLMMHLQQPIEITFGMSRANAGSHTNATWNARVGEALIVGDGCELRLAANLNWPERGTVQCDASGLDIRLLKDFIPSANSEAILGHLNFTGGWTNGPVAFQLAADATLKTKEQLAFSATAKVTGGKTGIAIEQLSISSATQIVCRAEGSLPVFLDPTRTDEQLQIDPTAPLRLQVFTDPKSILWEKIAAATGLRMQAPNLVANLEGTWAAPKGRVSMQVQKVELSGWDHPLPSVENLDFLAELDRVSARVTRLNFEIEKQPVSITGQIPLGESFWSGLRHQQRLPDWHEATAHLKIDHADLSAFALLMPQIFSAEGSASADISLEPGGNFHGELSVTNARTHPLESIGPVRNIQVLARLDGKKIQLENASGEIGGQRVKVDGNMEVNEQLLRTNGLPPFQLHVSGTNVPLARNPSILLRADLNLSATNSGSDVPVVSGSVKLRDSLFLADLQTLVPDRTSSARRRPPYFSVEVEPWAHWRLNINVQGDGFLRVQTPLFHGKVSTIVTVQGTLKEPLALGNVKIDAGSSITFPFSSLEVKQGFISLTSEDPYRPTLFVTAASRRFGYDVKMEATGPVDQPVVQFSSIPGLSSEEIVLMLTAGQIPRGLGVTATTQQRAQGLGLFVGKNLLSDFGLGGGGQERLTVRSGEEISESGRPTYDIEYKLSDRWSILGEYDRFDQYNLNLKFKVYSK